MDISPNSVDVDINVEAASAGVTQQALSAKSRGCRCSGREEGHEGLMTFMTLLKSDRSAASAFYGPYRAIGAIGDRDRAC